MRMRTKPAKCDIYAHVTVNISNISIEYLFSKLSKCCEIEMLSKCSIQEEEVACFVLLQRKECPANDLIWYVSL